MYIPCAFYISRNKRLKALGVSIITSSSDFNELSEEAEISKTKTGFNSLPAVRSGSGFSGKTAVSLRRYSGIHVTGIKDDNRVSSVILFVPFDITTKY